MFGRLEISDFISAAVWKLLCQTTNSTVPSITRDLYRTSQIFSPFELRDSTASFGQIITFWPLLVGKLTSEKGLTLPEQLLFRFAMGWPGKLRHELAAVGPIVGPEPFLPQLGVACIHRCQQYTSSWRA